MKEKNKMRGIMKACRGAAMAGMMAVAPIFGMVPKVAATSMATIDPMHSPATTVALKRELRGVTNNVTNEYGYKMELTSVHPMGATVTNIPTDIKIGFENMSTPDDHRLIKDALVPLDSMGFDKVGEYEFVLREVSSTDPVNFPVDKDNYYTIFVSVLNEVAEDGSLSGGLVYRVHSEIKNSKGEKTFEAKFENSAAFESVVLTKEVSGDMADRDRYFKFALKINGAKEGDRFRIWGQDNDFVQDGHQVSPAVEYVVGQEEGRFLYLKHGQSVKIGYNGKCNELPIGVSYTIQEIGAEDYQTKIDGKAVETDKTSEVKTVVSAKAVGGIDSEQYLKNMATKFVNSKQGSVKTGVVMNILPFVALATAAVALAIIAKKSKTTKR